MIYWFIGLMVHWLEEPWVIEVLCYFGSEGHETCEERRHWLVVSGIVMSELTHNAGTLHCFGYLTLLLTTYLCGWVSE